MLSGSESSCASLVDPDVLVSWHDVELVIADVEQRAMCPICLDPPLAAKITKCGHVYCAPCILHYLSLGARAWSRCPLCFEPVYPNAVKSLRFRLHNKVTAGQQLRMALVQRDKHSMMLEAAAPADGDDAVVDVTDVDGSAAGDASTSSLHVEWAAKVDLCTDRSLLSRVTFTSDVSSICARELSELAQAASLHLSSARSGGKEEPDIYYQYLLMAQEAVYRRLDEWQAAHPDSVDKVRRLLEYAHAAQQKQQREAAERLEKEAASKKQAEVKRQQAALPPSKRTPDMDDMSAFPSLASLASKPARPIRSLQPTATASTATPLQAGVEQIVAVVASSSAEQSSLQSAASLAILSDDANASSTPLRASRSAFFDSEEEERLHTRSLPASPSTPSLSTTPQRAAFPRFDPSSSYLFYQSVDGQHLFLHSMCYRALQAEGHALPSRVLGRVEWMDHYHVDADTRARFRFLSHLPLTTPFAIVALRLGDIVSAATANQFAGEWSDEVQARQQRSRAQQREAKRRHSRQQHQDQYGYGRSYSDRGVSLIDSPTGGGSYSSFASDAYEHALLSEPTNLESLDAQQQTAHFPSLGPHSIDHGNGNSSSSGANSQPASPALPSSPAVQQWNRVAEKGLAATSAAFWAPLPAATPTSASPNASAAWGRTLLNNHTTGVTNTSQQTTGKSSKPAWSAAADAAGKR